MQIFHFGVSLPLAKYMHEYLTFAGQSYEIRMLDNRKIGELPEITGKMVKVRTAHMVYINKCVQASSLSIIKLIPLNFRALSAWCFTTDDSSTQNISSWKAGAGTGPGIASLIWVSVELWTFNLDQTVLNKTPVGIDLFYVGLFQISPCLLVSLTPELTLHSSTLSSSFGTLQKEPQFLSR